MSQIGFAIPQRSFFFLQLFGMPSVLFFVEKAVKTDVLGILIKMP
jgi:hypothetical protein